MGSEHKYGEFRDSVSPEILRKLYQDHTDDEIGSQYEVTGAAVRYLRRRWGIETLSARQRRDQKRKRDGLPTVDDLTPVELAALYAQMGDRQIGKLYGVSRVTIAGLREMWEIQSLSKTDRATRVEPFSEEQRDVVVGVLLGDGHMTRKGTFKVSHSHAQAGYTRHLHRVLSPLSKPMWFYENEMRGSGSLTYEFGFSTVIHPWFKQVRKTFYPHDVKVFPKDILLGLSPRSLAYWYFDDGHFDGIPSFALGDVSQEEAENVARWVKERFALDTYIKSVSSSCVNLCVRARTCDIFFTLIQPFLLPELSYKVPAKYRPQGTHVVRPKLTKEAVQLPKDLRDRSEAWEHLGSESQERLLDDLVEFWQCKDFPEPPEKVEDLGVLHSLEFDQIVLQSGLMKRRNVGQNLCMTMMPHIWGTKSYSARHSPLEIFQDPRLLRKALRVLLNLGSIPNGSRVRSGVRLLEYSGAYNFRPAAAKVLVDRFCPPNGVVFDPCSGWGGRLLGTLLSLARAKYIACEPQPETHAGLVRLYQRVIEYLPELSGQVELHQVPAEDFTFPSPVDIVITSPPYWKKMTYGQGVTLAGNRYPTYESWRDGFWRPVFEKSVRALRAGGWVVFNVDDVVIDDVTCPLIEDTKRIARELGLGDPTEIYRYDMSKPGNRDNYEPIFCWSKGAGTSFDMVTPTLVTNHCDTCGRIIPSGVDRCKACVEQAQNTRSCEQCREDFIASRSDHVFCSQKCGARHRYERWRAQTPSKKTRTFTCKECGQRWDTERPGSFRYCPSCKAAKEELEDRKKRAKVCAYRLCGETFVDTSRQNSMSYCCVDHRRKEKAFRLGRVTNLSQLKR